jgi:ISXO2-like transposase domain
MRRTAQFNNNVAYRRRFAHCVQNADFSPALFRNPVAATSNLARRLAACSLPRFAKHRFPHQSVDHTMGQHVVGAVHTNTIEGFWSLIKRGVVGTYHQVSRKYLPLYVAEFEFRYNNRDNTDIFGAAIGRC